MPYISRNVIAWQSTKQSQCLATGGARSCPLLQGRSPSFFEGWAASKTVRTVHRLSREWLPLISTGEGRKKLPNAFNMLPASWYQLAPRHPPPAFCGRVYGRRAIYVTAFDGSLETVSFIRLIRAINGNIADVFEKRGKNRDRFFRN